jgi:hypothetical protein
MDTQHSSAELPPHLRQEFYATKPTALTVFLRTFIPWQMVRFALINLKMLRIISRSHH